VWMVVLIMVPVGRVIAVAAVGGHRARTWVIAGSPR